MQIGIGGIVADRKFRAASQVSTVDHEILRTEVKPGNSLF
jgi:hypothetical protein